MPAKKSDRKIATERREKLSLLMLELLTDETELDPQAIYHFTFTGNCFGVAAMLDRFMADFPENKKDLRAEVLATISLSALRRVI